MVRIFSAARCAGFRQEKSPGRVGRCRIPQRKSLRRCLGLFLCASRQVLLPGCFQANVQHCTWLGSPVCAACGGFSTWGNTWESRTLPDSMKKRIHPLRGGFFFSFHLQRSYSLVVFDECATLYLVRISSPAPCGRNRGTISPGRVGGKARKKLCAPVTSVSLVVFKPTSNIVLGVEIERALRAVQRDEGWNCKGAPRRRSKRKPLTLPHNTTSRAFTNTQAAVLPATAPFFNTIRPAPQGRSDKEKSNPT